MIANSTTMQNFTSNKFPSLQNCAQTCRKQCPYWSMSFTLNSKPTALRKRCRNVSSVHKLSFVRSWYPRHSGKMTAHALARSWRVSNMARAKEWERQYFHSNIPRQNGGIFKLPKVCFHFTGISPNQNR